jgi:hypothetical protein
MKIRGATKIFTVDLTDTDVDSLLYALGKSQDDMNGRKLERAFMALKAGEPWEEE